MSSLIELEEPFKSIWRKGYLQVHPSGRRYVHLYNNDKDRTLISYARYILSVKERRILPDDIEADHEDNDLSNDDPENIKKLTSKENTRKAHLAARGFIRIDTDQHCIICSKAFRNYKERLTCGEFSCKSEMRRRQSISLGLRPPVYKGEK